MQETAYFLLGVHFGWKRNKFSRSILQYFITHVQKVRFHVLVKVGNAIWRDMIADNVCLRPRADVAKVSGGAGRASLRRRGASDTSTGVQGDGVGAAAVSSCGGRRAGPVNTVHGVHYHN